MKKIASKKDIHPTLYRGIHEWLVKKYGKASNCKHCGIKGLKRYEYALIHGLKYEKMRSNYITLCNSCHSIYDGGIEKLIKATRKPVYAIKNDEKHYYISINDAARKLGIYDTAIGNALAGRSASSAGYKWIYA